MRREAPDKPEPEKERTRKRLCAKASGRRQRAHDGNDSDPVGSGNCLCL